MTIKAITVIRNLMPGFLEIAGGVIAVCGIAMIYLPLAVIIGGVLLALAGFTMDDERGADE